MSNRVFRSTVSNKKLKVAQLISESSLIQSVGNGLVILLTYWLFSSNFKILEIILFFLRFIFASLQIISNFIIKIFTHWIILEI